MDGETYALYALSVCCGHKIATREGTPESCRLEVYAACASARNNLIIRESAEKGPHLKRHLQEAQT